MSSPRRTGTNTIFHDLSSAVHRQSTQEVKSVLNSIWTAVLRVGIPGTMDPDFFALGGTSESALMVANMIRRANVNVSPSVIFTNPTLEALTALVLKSGLKLVSNTEREIWLDASNWTPLHESIITRHGIDRSIVTNIVLVPKFTALLKPHLDFETFQVAQGVTPSPDVIYEFYLSFPKTQRNKLIQFINKAWTSVRNRHQTLNCLLSYGQSVADNYLVVLNRPLLAWDSSEIPWADPNVKISPAIHTVLNWTADYLKLHVWFHPWLFDMVSVRRINHDFILALQNRGQFQTQIHSLSPALFFSFRTATSREELSNVQPLGGLDTGWSRDSLPPVLRATGNRIKYSEWSYKNNNTIERKAIHFRKILIDSSKIANYRTTFKAIADAAWVFSLMRTYDNDSVVATFLSSAHLLDTNVLDTTNMIADLSTRVSVSITICPDPRWNLQALICAIQKHIKDHTQISLWSEDLTAEDPECYLNNRARRIVHNYCAVHDITVSNRYPMVLPEPSHGATFQFGCNVRTVEVVENVNRLETMTHLKHEVIRNGNNVTVKIECSGERYGASGTEAIELSKDWENVLQSILNEGGTTLRRPGSTYYMPT